MFQRRMSRTHCGLSVFFCLFSSMVCKIPEVRVACVYAKDCNLPCTFPPTTENVHIQWFQQEALVLSSQANGESFSKGNVWLFSDHISDGNVSLLVKHVDVKSKGRYKCVISQKIQMFVAVTVEAPIQTVSISADHSGVIHCSTKDVYPHPVVHWRARPRLTGAALQATTRMTPGKHGLFSVDSSLKHSNSSSEQVYVCDVTSKYGTHTLTASLQLQEIAGSEGQDLIIPCKAPKNLLFTNLVWTFTRANQTNDVLVYNSQTQKSKRLWDSAKLVEHNVPKGDGSLKLKFPDSSTFSGIYTCTFTGEKSRHSVQSHVEFSGARQGRGYGNYQLWMLLIVVGLIALFVLLLLIKRYRAKSKSRKENARDAAEMQRMNLGKTAEEAQTGSDAIAQPSVN